MVTTLQKPLIYMQNRRERNTLSPVVSGTPRGCRLARCRRAAVVMAADGVSAGGEA